MASVATGPNCHWTAAVMNPWIRLDGSVAFVGPGTLALAIEPNRSFSSRAGRLEIHDDSNATRGAQAVVQRGAGCLYSTEPTAVKRSWLGTSDGSDVGAFEVRVHAEPSDCRWTATPSVPWMQLARYSPASGTGDGTIDVSILWNSSSAIRAGDVVIAGLSGVNPDAHLVVTQLPR